MRGFFLLLLLTNVAFIAWQYFQADGEQEPIDIYQGINMVNQGLTLIRELPPAQQPPSRSDGEEEAGGNREPLTNEMARSENAVDNAPISLAASEMSPAAKKEADTVEGVCQRIPGIDGRPEMQKILTLLRAREATVLEQGEMQIKQTSYWVLLPPYPSRAKADEAAAILSKKRIKDFLIVRSGEYQNAVSLGVFSTRNRASRRYRQIVELRVRLRRPTIETIEMPARRYFVKFKLSDAAALAMLQNSLKERDYPLAEKISCK